MLWIYIIIGLVVVIGLLYWIKSRKKGEGVDLSTPSTPPETPQPTESEKTTPSDEEKPM